MKLTHLLLILLLGLILVACASPQPQAPSNSGITPAKSEPTVTSVPTTTSVPATQSIVTQAQTNPDDLVRVDTQGAVEFTVQPINLDNPGDSIVFEVSMNTHSVNLDMDVSILSVLSTDNGNSVQAVSWDGGTEGGHHVSGNLSFPASNNGKPILDGAKQLTLTVKDVDAPERVFTWELSQ